MARTLTLFTLFYCVLPRSPADSLNICSSLQYDLFLCFIRLESARSMMKMVVQAQSDLQQCLKPIFHLWSGASDLSIGYSETNNVNARSIGNSPAIWQGTYDRYKA